LRPELAMLLDVKAQLWERRGWQELELIPAAREKP
jgi:hypothetical protein